MKPTINILKQVTILLALFSCQLLQGQNWVYVAGIAAQDIAVGKNGSVWATGTNHAIYKWNGSSWQTIPGGGERIAVDPEGAAWTLSQDGQIWKYNLQTSSWELKPGSAKDIGIGADGSVWVIGLGTTQGGYEIYKWTGSGWSKIPGGAVRIAVDPSGNAWIVNSTNTIFHYNGSGWDTKPGAAKDIGVGANGAVWCTAPDYQIFQWDGTNWKLQSGGATQVSVAPDGNAWAANNGGQVYRSTDAITAFVQIRTIFPRGQSYEYRMLQALKMYPYSTQVNLGGSTPQFSAIDALGQEFGRLGLWAAEIYFINNSTITPDQVLAQIGSITDGTPRQSVCGILAVLVLADVSSNSTSTQTAALRTWATSLYRSIKIRSAKAVLDEYNKWKNNWCAYEGISDAECKVKSQGITSLITTQKPPADLVGKNGLQNAMSDNTGAIAGGVATAVTVLATTAAGVALTSTLGVIVGSTLVNTMATPILLTTTSLYAAFGGTGGVGAGAIGAAGWAGVVAAPIAAAVLCVVVGTMEGFAVVEAAKVEPTLKMKLGAAMSEYINIKNVAADSSASNMFFVAFQEAATKNFLIPQPKVDGEVRFYCQAGYVSSFKLTYTDGNGQSQSLTTPDLPVGQEKSFVIPYNATNIRLQGWYLNAGWKDLFNTTLDRPTYICYTSYGTIFAASYKTDCPEVGNMTTKQNQLTVTQGGGYVAWIRLEYNEGGQTKRVLDKNDCGGGWRQVFDIPATATNIHLVAWSATGLVWDPWKTIIDKSWPTPPNECIKVYNTSLEPKSNNECN